MPDARPFLPHHHYDACMHAVQSKRTDQGNPGSSLSQEMEETDDPPGNLSEKALTCPVKARLSNFNLGMSEKKDSDNGYHYICIQYHVYVCTESKE